MTERHLSINFDDVTAAFEDASGAVRYYLDLQTGRVVAIGDEIRDELHAINREYQDASEAEDIVDPGIGAVNRARVR
jgi:hypothetical protein